MSAEYIIYADESAKRGKYFSNFYGGVLIRSEHFNEVQQVLAQAKLDQNLFDEIKWSKVTEPYLPKYIAVIDRFFDLVEQSKIKVRIMFTKNSRVATGLQEYHRARGYHLLYYQFLKHAFGLAYCDNVGTPVYVRFYLDNMPRNGEMNSQFKGYLAGMQNYAQFRNCSVRIREEDIAEIDSSKHDVAQYLDIILGSIQFRLNDKHLEIPPGKSRRGKRTKAKEKLYKHIYKRICTTYPRFNTGVSTSVRGNLRNRWDDPYRHWVFTPKNYEIDSSLTKK